MKTKILTILAIIFILFDIWSVKSIVAPTISKNPTENFNSNQNLTFKGENIEVEAASCSKFTWINPETGEAISGILQKEVPLGVSECENYYKSNKIVVQNSYWENISGSAEFSTSSNSNYEIVQEVDPETIFGLGFTMTLLFIVIWLLVMLLI